MKFELSFLISLFISSIHAQYNPKTFNWKDAGFKGPKPVYSQNLNILNFGGDNTNNNSNNLALSNAISALNNQGGTIYFPPGVYKFTASVSISRDSIQLKGAGYDSTQLRFNLNGNIVNCININGSAINSDTTAFLAPGYRDSSKVTVFNPNIFSSGDWVYLQCNDSSYMASTWAYGSLGQVMQIKSISGNTIEFQSPFRFNFNINLKPRIKKINPKKAIEIECLSIKREDATTSQTSNISLNYAIQCRINGIKSDSTNYAHIELNRCSNVDVSNSYFHHAFAYGGSGQGYGIALQYSTNECKIENNIFQNLRHSILLQAGANGNVIGYNYSYNPFWTQFPLPSASAGDLVLHGNYPFANLFEGNINQNTVIDNSHQKNGPYNTFYRNRSELFGIFMNTNPATDTTQFIGNEVTNSNAGFGLYTLVGNGNFEFGNNIKGSITPAGTSSIPDTSLYYSGFQRPHCFDPFIYNWPILGSPQVFNSNSIPAKDRAQIGQWAICECPLFNIGIETAHTEKGKLRVFPNPSNGLFEIVSKEELDEISIFDLRGLKVHKENIKLTQHLDLRHLKSGIYILNCISKSGKVWRERICKYE